MRGEVRGEGRGEAILYLHPYGDATQLLLLHLEASGAGDRVRLEHIVRGWRYIEFTQAREG